ncbi:PBPRA1643 family SWIM/SEC-C metal-binding motif protein [Litoribrevibacter euphylliae]|uniref:PBPRA1643 family SWIM/SEC-C metal-binding motif protein n=1 Tax=Litoribrevibacter euphylliae TaxID=1834034 RepID=A0ABV7HML6_9GAMM
MSKFFYKGKIEKKPKHASYGFTTNRETRPGTEDAPLTLRVVSEARKVEIEALLAEHQLFAVIDIDAKQAEDIAELDALISTPETQRVEKTPGRNDPCSCGSGKKFKKCCG